MINKNNIEEKLFDYFEGDLTSAEKSDLERFLESNQEYKSDFDAWEKSYLPQEEFKYDRVQESIVAEKGGAYTFLENWKAGLLMLAVGLGLSTGLYQQLHEEDGSLAAASQEESEEKQNSTSSNEPNESITSTEFSSSQLKNDLQMPTLDTESSHLQGADAGLGFSGSSHDNGQSVHASGSSDAWGNSGKSGSLTRAIPSVAGNVDQLTKEQRRAFKTVDQRGSSSSVASSKVESKRVDGSENISLKEALAQNTKYDHIQINAEVSNIEGLFTNPKIKKARSKFEKYDKNELRFQNERDPFFILPNGVALAVNPSFSGNGKGIRLSYNYNYEWPELNDNFNTQMVAVDAYVKALKGGVGVMLISDVMGHNKFATKGVEVIYSPKIVLFGKTTFEPSVKYGYYQKSVAFDQLKSDELIDPRTGSVGIRVKSLQETPTASSDSYSNLGVGFLLNTSKLYVGFAYDQITDAAYDFNGHSEKIQVQGKLTAQVGGSIVPIKDLDYLVLSPALHFVKVGGYDKVWLSNVLKISRLFLGSSYSFNKEYLLSVGYDNEVLRVSYAYGKTKSMMDQSADNLSLHQVGLTFSFITNRRR